MLPLSPVFRRIPCCASAIRACRKIAGRERKFGGRIPNNRQSAAAENPPIEYFIFEWEGACRSYNIFLNPARKKFIFFHFPSFSPIFPLLLFLLNSLFHCLWYVVHCPLSPLEPLPSGMISMYSLKNVPFLNMYFSFKHSSVTE